MKNRIKQLQVIDYQKDNVLTEINQKRADCGKSSNKLPQTKNPALERSWI